MNRNIAYLSLLDKHEKAMHNRSRKATHEQFVCIKVSSMCLFSWYPCGKSDNNNKYVLLRDPCGKTYIQYSKPHVNH